MPQHYSQNPSCLPGLKCKRRHDATNSIYTEVNLMRKGGAEAHDCELEGVSPHAS
jgi:hypothetical protein